jgi:hypothetical protein
LIAVGTFVRPHLSIHAEIVPSHLWSELECNFSRSSAQSDDVKVTNVRVYTRAQIESLGPPNRQAAVDPYRSGLTGRPTIKHLIVAEFERRAAAGELESTLAAQGRALAQWAAREHPEAPAPTPRTIETQIRPGWNASRAKRTK